MYACFSATPASCIVPAHAWLSGACNAYGVPRSREMLHTIDSQDLLLPATNPFRYVLTMWIVSGEKYDI